MIRHICAVIAAALAIAASAGAAACAVKTSESVGGCDVDIYQFGSYRLHAFATNDPVDDECFIVESPTGLVAIELPGRVDDLDAWRGYVEDIGKPMRDILISSHPYGGRYISAMGLRAHATQRAKESIESGTIMETVMRLGETVPGWDASMAEITDVIEGDAVRIGGISFVIIPNGDAYDIGIPAINAVCTHMFGADTHGIVPSIAAADTMIGSARMYLEDGYTMILSGHHRPEGRADARRRINYLERLKDLVESCEDSDLFREAMRAEFPKMGGEHALELSAAMIYGTPRID